MIHPIPPGLWCVPSALVAITGEPFDAVIHPALNRHGRADMLTEMVTASSMSAAIATLQELRYRVLRYKKPDLHAKVSVWAQRSKERYPGRILFVSVERHCVVICDGRVYDSWTPHGEVGERHPYRDDKAYDVYLVEAK